MQALSLDQALPSRDHAALPAEMRALLQRAYGSTEVLSVGTTTTPHAGPGEVVVKVHAAGLDRGTWHMMTGRPYLMRLMGFGFRRPKNPVAGLDLSGTVVEVGPGVTRFSLGDQVFGLGMGSFAEFARAREDKLALAPRRLSLDEAAVLGVSGITAHQALTDVGQVKPGERVLVIGASGGVGTYAVQIARALGAEVTGVCTTEKIDLVKSLGVSVVVDHRREDFAALGPVHDLVLDVGGGASVARLRRAMTPRGRLVFVGNELGGDFSGGFGRQLHAFMLAPFVQQRFAMLMSDERAERLERLAAMCDEGFVRPMIDRRVDLAGVPAALADMEAGRVRGKVLVRL